MKWTPDKVAYLVAEYPHGDTSVIAKHLGVSERRVMVKACELGVKKHRDAKRVWTRGTGKGTGFGDDPGRFNRGKPSPRRMPLGATFTTAKGEVFVKVAMTGDKATDWKLKHRVDWEKKNGRALRSDEVVRPDGTVATKKDIINEISLHNYPREIGQMYRAIGHITRAIRKTK